MLSLPANTIETTSLSFTRVTSWTLCSFACELFSAHSLPRCAHFVNPLTSDLCPHLLSLVLLHPSLPPTQCNTRLLSHETKTRGDLKINHVEGELVHLYLCVREGTERREKIGFHGNKRVVSNWQ